MTMNQHTIIWLHGLGASGDDFITLSRELALPDSWHVSFVLPDAPVIPVTLNQGYPMRAWFDVYGLTQGFRVDRAGIIRSRESVHQMLMQAFEQGTPWQNIMLGGFSQGASLALLAGLSFKEKIGGIVALSGFLPTSTEEWLKDCNPLTAPPIFLAHGKKDNVVSYALGECTRDALIKAHCSPDWHDYDDLAHSVSAQELLDLRTWIISKWRMPD